MCKSSGEGIISIGHDKSQFQANCHNEHQYTLQQLWENPNEILCASLESLTQEEHCQEKIQRTATGMVTGLKNKVYEERMRF